MAVSLLLMALFFFLFLSKRNEIIFQRKGLPPGAMGWPFFGETNEFLKLGPNFMRRQRARYGRVFKSHILGSPTIVSIDRELNGYILLNEAKGLIPGYPKSMLDILGKRNIAAVYGSQHKVLRKNLLCLIGAPLIKDRLLPRLDKYIIRLHLLNWDGMVIDIRQKCGDGRSNVVKILRQVIEKRRAASASGCGAALSNNDMLQQLVLTLNDEDMIDQIITILYSGYY